MVKLIINADDFGLTSGVNEAIIQSYKEGVLTSATLMAGGLAWQEAVDLALENPGLGVGVHLTLTALKPVLPPMEVPSLVDSQGKFRRQLWRAPIWNKELVKREWRAQIQRLVERGLRPTHLDSHHHSHLWPSLTEVMCQLAKDFSIPAVRVISPRSFEIMGIGGWQKGIAKLSWNRANRFSLGKPDTVVGIQALSGNAQGVQDYLNKLGPGVHELFCHPGIHSDSGLVGLSSLKEQRDWERKMLLAPWLKELFKDVCLTSFNTLGEERI